MIIKDYKKVNLKKSGIFENIVNHHIDYGLRLFNSLLYGKLNYLNNREITYRDNRKLNTINPNNINKNTFFFKANY